MHKATEEKMTGTLYVVATPIGNLHDMTARAREVLARVSVVACEDTRVSSFLLQQLPAKPRLIALHHHNEHHATEKIIAILQSGSDVAVVSDAGTPAVSDPGAILVAAAHLAQIPVCPLPGPSAAIAALSASGFLSNQFRFIGFLPPKSGARRSAIAALAHDAAIQILYEAPHRIVECLQDLLAELGPDRQIVMCRELTKTFETIRRAPLGELLPWVMADTNQQRGEFVLVLDAAPTPDPDAPDPAAAKLLAALVAVLPTKTAAQITAEFTGISKNRLYEQALAMKDR